MRVLRMPRDGNGGGDGDRMISMDEVRRLIQREGHGDSNEAIRVLLRDNKKARTRASKAEQELADLKTKGRIAPDGAVILTGDDAVKVWPTISKFLSENKLTPEQLIEAHTKAGKLEGEVSTMKRKELYATVATELGWNGDALAEVLELKKLDVRMGEVVVKDDDGKSVKKLVPQVRTSGDDKAPWEPLETFAEENLKTFIPALAATESEEGSAPRTRKEREQQTTGTRVPEQTRSRPSTGKGKSDDDIRNENYRDNPGLAAL